ncbi:MAG: septal ring lytic transglycosylase RlpA family protein [Alphaproteobacteria bacterium]|nr:septal ring lytic transglycosylase RlpA family protein [Alphaproteobacteria bacterium]
MMRTMWRLPLFGTLAALLWLPGCTSLNFGSHLAKTVGEKAGLTSAPKGYYKIGEPYQINGIWYYPKVDYQYDETGIASWYGEAFHAKLTANGEIYDMNDLTAAHRTLPMPSLVRVTNLENGRSMVVRINDRGPFAAGRIIDLSRRSAQLLGIERAGTAKVRVQILPEESRNIAEALTQGRPEPAMVVAASDAATDTVQVRPDAPNASPRASVAVQALPVPGSAAAPAPPPVAAQPTAPGVVLEVAKATAERQVAALQPVQPVVTTVPVVPTEIYVQAGAFANVNNAVRVSAALQPVGRAIVAPRQIRDQLLYRVRFGPFSSVEEADRTLARVIQAGYPDARVIVDQ